MKHIRIVSLLSFTLVVVAAFQNCGQQGGLSIEGAPQNIAKASTDTLVVNPDGAINTDGVSLPAADNNQVSGGGGNVVSGNDDPANSHNSGGAHSSENCNEDNEHDNDDHHHNEKNSCDGIDVADFMLKIESIHVGDGSKSADVIALEEPDASISMNKQHISIRATKDVFKVKSLFIVLKNAGNKVLDLDNLSHDLKTPSGQTAGLKVHLDSEVNLKAGEIYSLEFSIKQEEQIIANPAMCLFKPVIKSARIVEALVHAL